MLSKNLIKKITPRFFISWYHFMLALGAAVFYRFPSKKLKVIGVTGTHGKTTTVDLATTILEGAGYKVAAASSIKFYIAGRKQENKLKMTMPGRGALQKFLRQAMKAGCKYALIECTSEGVLQHRHRFIQFDSMVFTNLYREHIERHGSFQNYRQAKTRYFEQCRNKHILNIDDKNVDYFLKFPAKHKHFFSTTKCPTSKQCLVATNIQLLNQGMVFEIRGLQFDLNLRGEFNIYNALAAISIGLAHGVSLSRSQQALAKAKGVPGRMEEIIKTPFKVVIDYAFTPAALEQVYQTLKKQENAGLVCVLGACGGGRDKWKRPELGKIAQKYCREIIITNEDPYDEDPMEIINQVASGAGAKAKKILDRRQAIQAALKSAQPQETVIITGKGCEPWICAANGQKIPWDDRQVARQGFAKLDPKA
jgi:UDP-N-acetylmuramoyl-L-alanyl-D-glutamate--2,6-diaminopimelate ligase